MANLHGSELSAQRTRLAAESELLHRRDQAEINRLIGDLTALTGRYQLLEMSILSTSSSAGQSFAARQDPSFEEKEKAVESDQGSNWQRVQRRMIREEDERFKAQERARKMMAEAGRLPTPPEAKPGEKPLARNDLARVS